MQAVQPATIRSRVHYRCEFEEEEAALCPNLTHPRTTYQRGWIAGAFAPDPRDTENQALLRPLPRKRSAPPVRAGPSRCPHPGRAGQRSATCGAPGLPAVRRRRGCRIEVAPAAVAHRPEGRPPSGAGVRRRRRHGGAVPPDLRSGRPAGRQAPGRRTGARRRPRPPATARPDDGLAAGTPGSPASSTRRAGSGALSRAVLSEAACTLHSFDDRTITGTGMRARGGRSGAGARGFR